MDTPENALQRQRIAFYFALANFLWLVGWGVVEARIAYTGEDVDRFKLSLDPIVLYVWPIWMLCGVAAAVIGGNSMWLSKRATWYGVVTLGLLAVPGLPLAVIVINSFWCFLTSN